MDLAAASDERFLSHVRAFLAANWPAGGLRDPAALAAFRASAVEAGLLYRSVPKRYGGSEQEPDDIHAEIIRGEFRRVGAPRELPGVGVALLVPTLLANGTPEQCARFIPATLNGDIAWCQGYSEPEAGSDLESLRTTAVLTEDAPPGEWVINGQKVWTSGGADANWMFLLARTEPGRPRREGLSFLLLDMDQPGVEVRPLRQVTGSSEFSEVFLTDARTPADLIVGPRGAGWTVSRTTLTAERTTLAGPDGSAALVRSLVRLARQTDYDGVPAIEHPVIRARLADLLGWVDAQRFSAYRQDSARGRAAAGRGRHGTDLALFNKLLATEVAEQVSRIALEIIGPAAAIDPLGAARPGAERWLNQFFGSLGVAIAGGTSNIQRNMIAERGLGLPREPAPGEPAVSQPTASQSTASQSTGGQA